MPSRIHLLTLGQQSFGALTQIHSQPSGVCPIDCIEFDPRELIGYDGVVIPRGEPVGDHVGEGYGKESSARC